MNDITANIIAIALSIIVGYFIGAIPNGVLVGKIFFKKDPRTIGSGNIGGSNSGRAFGPKIGFLVIFLDMFKTALAFYIVFLIIYLSPLKNYNLFDNGTLYCFLTLLFASIGHCYSIYLKFQGGKAVSCFMAATSFTSYLGAIVVIITFFSIFKFKKKIMSLSVLISGLIIVIFQYVMALICFLLKDNLAFLMWDFGISNILHFGCELSLVSTLIYILLVLRHHQNIKRIKNGEEKQLEW